MPAPITYYKNYPEPFYPDWQNEPVPGWGVRPVAVGPARVGVGQLRVTKVAARKFAPTIKRKMAPVEEAPPLPGERKLATWQWAAIGVVTLAAAAGVYWELRR